VPRQGNAGCGDCALPDEVPTRGRYHLRRFSFLSGGTQMEMGSVRTTTALDGGRCARIHVTLPAQQGKRERSR
jgi:hypothetical protein